MTEPSPLSGRAALGTLALTAASLVAYEVLLTRLLSVVTWYGLAFLVLSLAMLGLTRGSLRADEARAQGAALGPWLAARQLELALALLVATLAALVVPLEFRADAGSFGALLLVAAAATYPLSVGGAVVARLLSEGPAPLSKMYAVDLVAAALGALAPLLLLGPLSAPDAIALLAALSALASAALAAGAARRRALVAAGALFALVTVGARTPHGLALQQSKGDRLSAAQAPQFERWNALSYVRAAPFAPLPFPYWSVPARAPRPPVRAALALIDGEAGTYAYAYNDLRELAPLRADGTFTAHVLRPDGEACVIGIGGGRDLAAALVAGHSRVTGVEINPALVELLRAVEPASPLLRDPRVRVLVGDGRATLARLDVRCRVLQASMVDTWAATAAGAFAHAESTLYTREAWRLFLRRTEPDGVLTFSRWYDPARPSETARLLALALASLRDRGVHNARANVALVAAGRVATLLASPAPLRDEDLARLRAHASHFGLALLAVPDAHAADPLLEALLSSSSDEEAEAVGAGVALDTSAPTDERPFFFQLFTAAALAHPLATYRAAAASEGALLGNVRATGELLLTFLAVLAVGAALLGPALLRAARERTPPLPGRASALYFACLGAGYMLVELALVQRLHVVLGHPSYALVLVLCALLVATGAGSALSARLAPTRDRVRATALLAGALVAAAPYALLRPLARLGEASSFGLRAAGAVLVSALLGLVLGVLFPAGVRYVDRERGAKVALAVNGASSVLGGVGSVLVSVWLGIPESFLLAGALYLTAAFCAPPRWRAVEPAS